VVDNEDEELEEDNVLMDAMEAGAADMEAEEGIFTIYTDPADVTAVADYMTEHGYKLLSAQEEMVPQSYITLTAEGDIKNMQKMLDAFEDNDDVQNVWHNWDNNE
jgi:transcriptional/translational regulatory protein YebC/TACO1